MPWNIGKNLVIGLVPFNGNPDLYIDNQPFNESKQLSNYKWISEESLDDRIVITP